MNGMNLLKHALKQKAERVLDIGVGNGVHARAFMSNGSEVVGVDIRPCPIESEKNTRPRLADKYTHIQSSIEDIEFQEDAEPFDLIWSCHTLEHIPNIQLHLVQLHDYLKDDGWLYIAVPCSSQERLHVGHLSLWTPALLIYNLICAGWDCSDAQWYTSYQTIGLCIKKKLIEDMSWRRAMPDEQVEMNEYTPVKLRHEHGAWLANNWHEELPGRSEDPPMVTVGICKTDLPPQTQLAFGPNPKLREGYERNND